jgi:hypothetical protein
MSQSVKGVAAGERQMKRNGLNQGENSRPKRKTKKVSFLRPKKRLLREEAGGGAAVGRCRWEEEINKEKTRMERKEMYK